MYKAVKFLSVLLALMLCFSASAIGQETTGNIEGTVTDPNGAVVPGVTVELISQSYRRSVTTNDQGFFRALQLQPGIYTVSAKATNFQPFEQQNVQVVLGQTTPVNIRLGLTAVGAEVLVTDAVDLAIDPTSSRVQTNLTERELELLPKGTGFTSALKAVPSVRNEPSAAGFSVDGATGVENSFILDGQEVSNFRTGGLNDNNNLPFQLVKEVQVKNSGFEAEFGGATGGVINVITKSGGNEFHGDAGISFRVPKFNANSRPILFGDDAALEYIIPTREDGVDFFPYATLGGPIIKDRAWFFVSASPQYFNEARNWTFRDGSVGRFVSKEKYEYYFARVDASITDNLRVYSTFTYNPITINGTLPTFNQLFGASSLGSSSTVDPIGRREFGGRQPSNNFNINASWVATPNLVFSGRYSRGYINEKLQSYGIPDTLWLQCSNSGIAFGFPCQAGFSNIPTNDRTVRDISIRNNFEIDSSILVDNFVGRHQFKVGYQRFNIYNDVESGYVTPGRVLMNFGRTTATSDGEIFGNRDGEAGYARLVMIGEFGEASSSNEAFYIQDSWQPTSRLTLNLGVRFERESVPSFTPGFEGISFGFGDKIAPRLGFAYDIFGNGKWKIFANYGKFYDRFKYELPRGSFGGNIFDDYRAPILEGTDLSLYTKEYVLANSLVYTNFRVPSNDPSDFRVDPDLKPVQQTEWTFGTQIDLGADTILGARYTHKQIDETIEDIGYHTSNEEGAGSEGYFIGNPGSGICAEAACGRYEVGAPGAKPIRKYDALEVTLDKRFARNFTINASYTFSRLFGNYSGLASTDEFSVNGLARDSPNVNRFFDTPFGAFTVGGEPNEGRLPTDRPHQFKFFGAYTFNNQDSFLRLPPSQELELSLFQIVQSGTPITSRVDLIFDAYVPLFGRGDLGRTEMYTQTDLGLAYRYKFGRDNRFGLQFNIDVLNAFNEANVLSRFESITAHVFQPGDFAGVGVEIGPTPDDASGYREFDRAFFDGRITAERIMRLINEDLVVGFDEDTGDPIIDGAFMDARYNQPQFFQGPRSVRFGFRFIF